MKKIILVIAMAIGAIGCSSDEEDIDMLCLERVTRIESTGSIENTKYLIWYGADSSTEIEMEVNKTTFEFYLWSWNNRNDLGNGNSDPVCWEGIK